MYDNNPYGNRHGYRDPAASADPPRGHGISSSHTLPDPLLPDILRNISDKDRHISGTEKRLLPHTPASSSGLQS